MGEVPHSEHAAAYKFPKAARLLKRQEFDRVFAARVAARDKLLTVRVGWADSASAAPRLGLAVSRRVGNAVVRNRWKRLLREAFRMQRHRLPRGVELVVLPQAPPPSLAEVTRSLLQTTRRAVKRLPERSGGQS